MSVETRPGSTQFAESFNSPQSAEQRFYPRNNHRFPENRREFLALLMREIPALGIDCLSLVNDFTRGFWVERAQLNRELRNGLDVSGGGDGSVAVIAPGYGGTEWWYYPLEDFLERNGHTPVFLHHNSIVNDEPIAKRKERHMETIINLYKKSGRKVHFIGDSQGGLTAAAMAVDYPKDFQKSVEDVWFIGAPKPRRVNLLIGIAYLWSQMWHRENDFGLVRKLERLEEIETEGKVPFRSIYSPSDVALPEGLPIGVHFPTNGSHIGGAVNLQHLKLIVSTWAERADLAAVV